MALEELLVKLTSKLDAAGFKELDRMEKRADRQTRILSNSLRRMFVGVVGTIGAREILDATVKMDSLRTSFAALAGSDVGGAQQIEYLRKETQRLGQDFVTAAEAYKNLFSAGVGAGMGTDQIQQIFSSVLEAGTVLGSSQQQMQGALMALEQMISKGKVSMEELRRQLGNALPGAMQIAAKAMGTTSAGLQEMLESGLDSELFVTRFANQLHKEFGGKAVEASHTLRAELARLNNAFFNLKTSVLDGDAGKELGQAIAQLAQILESPILLKSLNAVGKVLVFLLKNIRLIVGIGVVLGIKRLGAMVYILGLDFLTASHKIKALDDATRFLVRGQIVQALRTITAAMWATLRPIALWVAGLLLIIELIDTLRGKRTVLKEIAEAMPTAKQFVNSEKGQNLIHDTEKNMWQGVYKDLAPWYGVFGMYNRQKYNPAINPFENTYLQDSGLYNKDGTLKGKVSQTNNVTINVTAPQGLNENQVANLVGDKLLGIFETVRVRNGYPQTEVV